MLKNHLIIIRKDQIIQISYNFLNIENCGKRNFSENKTICCVKWSAPNPPAGVGPLAEPWGARALAWHQRKRAACPYVGD